MSLEYRIDKIKGKYLVNKIKMNNISTQYNNGIFIILIYAKTLQYNNIYPIKCAIK